MTTLVDAYKILKCVIGSNLETINSDYLRQMRLCPNNNKDIKAAYIQVLNSCYKQITPHTSVIRDRISPNIIRITINDSKGLTTTLFVQNIR